MVVGGGALLDAVGLCAALLFRGVRWISVPTTLLAQADAGIGGWTAVDLGGRKNLLGAFHPPAFHPPAHRRVRRVLAAPGLPVVKPLPTDVVREALAWLSSPPGATGEVFSGSCEKTS